MRAVHFAALMGLCGREIFALYVKSAPAVSARTRRLLAALALASALAWVILLLIDLAGGAKLLEIETVRAFFLETSFGPAWLAHLAIIAVTLAVLTCPRPQPVTIALLASLNLLTLAPIGHAARFQGLAEVLALALQAGHLAGGALWLGGLWGLAATLPRPDKTSAVPALRRFSFVASFAVGLILFTGIIKSLNAIENVDILLSTPWGRTLAIKLGLVALMLALAGCNRFLLLPRLERQETSATPALIHRLTLAEIILGGGVLMAAAILGSSALPT